MKECLRRCLNTREQFPKSELLRLVRVDETSVVVDRTGKQNGRGAYLRKGILYSNDKKLKNKIQQALKIKMSDEEFENLLVEINKGE